MTTLLPSQPTANPRILNDTLPANPSITFVLCIEAGPLELQCLWLVESLRRWGGRFAGADVVAVIPRLGPPLTPRIRKALHRLDVRIESIRPNHRQSWYANLNKATALAWAEQNLESEVIAWLDSDIFVIGEPRALLPRENEEFTAMPASTCHDIGSTGEHSEKDPYWRTFCRVLGINHRDLPMIPSLDGEAGVQRMYWQGGVFAYRRSTNLGQKHLETFLRRIRTRIASRHAGIYFYDQTSLSLAVYLKDLRYRCLPQSHNFGINKLRADEISHPSIPHARILHYFGSLWPDFYQQLVDILQPARPEVAEWLREKGPLHNPAGWSARASTRILKRYRSAKIETFKKNCSVY